MSERYELRGWAQGLEGMIEINGVPVERWFEAPMRSELLITELEPWMERGTNRCRVLVQRAPSSAEPELELELVQRRGIAEVERRTLLRIEPGGQSTGVFDLEFEARPQRTGPVQARASRLEYGETLVDDARRFALEARDEILAGDVDGLVRRRAAVLRDALAECAERLEGGRGPAVARSSMAELVEPGGPRLRRFGRDELRVDLVGGSRLLWVTRRNYAPVFAFDDEEDLAEGGLDDEPSWTLPLYLGRVDGALRWLR